MEKARVKKLFIDASPSWNGYNYQAKVGLFVVLNMIHNENITEKEMKKYTLELEWFEDFSIKKEEEYITIHQVKSLNSDQPSSYKDAIWTLLYKLLFKNEIKRAYLHTVNDLSEKEELMKDKFKFTSVKDNIPLQCKILVWGSGKYDELFSKFKFYNYSEQENEFNFSCEINEIEKRIKEKIKLLYSEHTTDIQIDRAYYSLLGMIDKNIKNRHVNIQNGDKKEKVQILFEDIYQVVILNHDSISKDYAIYKMRNDFEKSSFSYIDELKKELENENIEKESLQKFIKIIKKICDIPLDKFFDFCLKIMPDSLATKESSDYGIELYRELNESVLVNCFFLILEEVKQEFDEDAWVYVKENKIYLPSVINDVSRHSNRVLTRISKNENPELLMEIDQIITTNITKSIIDVQTFYASISDDESLEEMTIEEKERHHNRITVMKKVGLIKLNDAKEVLNNENVNN